MMLKKLSCIAFPLSRAAVVVLLAFIAGESWAAKPVVSRMEPLGVQRGGQRTVIVHGDRLADARQILFYEPGITVVEMKPLDERKVEVKLEVTGECRLGLHLCNIVTATGISNGRVIAVGNLPEVAEVEPNSDFAAPQVVELGSTITGTIQAEDEDFFAVELKKGDRLAVEVEGVRTWYGLRNDFFDPYVAILDANRYEQVVNDDVPLLYQDPVCLFTAPADGRYVIVIRDSSYGGAGDFAYRLHMGKFPRPMAVLPPGGEPGQLLDALFIEADGSTTGRQIQLSNPAVGGVPLTMENEFGVSPSPLWVSVGNCKYDVEVEPNNDNKQPTVGAMPVAFNGQLATEKDEDWFEFEAKKGQKIIVRAVGRKTIRSPVDTVVNVYGPDYRSIAGNDDSGGPDSLVTFTAPADGPHRIRITDHLGRGGPTFVYRIEVAPAAPSLALSLPEVQEDETVNLVVPQGNRMAVMVNAQRAEFGGELKISVEGLPPGVMIEPVTMRADQGTVPVIISAASDAAVNGVLVRVAGRPVAEDVKLDGSVIQRHKLVRGQNRRDVFGLDTDRVALAVTDPSPVTVEVVQPQVPIVRDGSMQVKVKIKRAEGFKEAVPVRFLYNPPGIGSSGSVSIPADKDEAEIPITANSSAAIGTWPVIIIANVNSGRGNVEVASAPIALEIADRPFVFEFPKATGEQGGQTMVTVRVTVNRQLDGPAEVELVGVPAGVTCSVMKQALAQDSEELVFPMMIAADARVGQHKTLVCRATIHAPGGDIVETMGTGLLQIDQPIQKPAAPAAAPEQPKPAVAPVAKPLSRIEQLRQQQAEQGGAK